MGAIDYRKVKIGRSMKSLPSMLYWWQTLFHKFLREGETSLSLTTSPVRCEGLILLSTAEVKKPHFFPHHILTSITLDTWRNKFKICVIYMFVQFFTFFFLLWKHLFLACFGIKESLSHLEINWQQEELAFLGVSCYCDGLMAVY